jgi:hypothetical protein
MKCGLTAIVGVIASLACISSACAQAVQLPTFRYFSVQTTVSVPDRGGVMMGGVDRASSGSTSRGFGPLRNRASGSSIGSSGVSVHATIIDNNELDQQVLAEARRQRSESLVLRNPPPPSPVDSATALKADYLSRNVARAEAAPQRTPAPAEAIDSVADLRTQATAREDARLTEAKEKLAAGMAAEEAGKLASARGSYEAAMRLGDDEIRHTARDRYARIALPTSKSQRVARGPASP